MTSLSEVYDNTVRRDTRSVIRRESIQKGESQSDMSKNERQEDQKDK